MRKIIKKLNLTSKFSPLSLFVNFRRLPVGMSVFLLILSLTSKAASIPEALFNAVNEIEKLDEMRIGLAKTLNTKESGLKQTVTKETFVRVCKPVGIQAMNLSKSQPWNVKQTSDKYRNPKNKPNTQELKAIQSFKKDPFLTSFYWQQTEGPQKGHYYFRKITTQTQCLACHGSKKDLPDFIKKEYTKDLAHGFKSGDLRGIYSVFLGENSGEKMAYNLDKTLDKNSKENQANAK